MVCTNKKIKTTFTCGSSSIRYLSAVTFFSSSAHSPFPPAFEFLTLLTGELMGLKWNEEKWKKKIINLNNIIHRLGDIISHWSSDVYLLYYIIYECKRTRVQVYYYCYLLCAPRWSGVSPVINSNNHVVISFVFNWLYRSRRGALCNSVWPIRYFFIIIHRRPSRLLVYIIYTRIYPNSCIN